MSLESDLLQPERQADAPQPEPAKEDPPPPPAPELNLDDDAAVDAALKANAIEVPDGDALVPTSEAGKIAHGYREKIRGLKKEIDGLKEGSAKTAQLEQQVQQLQAQLQQVTPYVQAYQAALQAQPSEDPADKAELEEIARDMEFFKADGSLDLDRATRQRTRELARAQKIARAEVAPIHQTTVQQQSHYNLQRAKNTVTAEGTKPDPAILEALWQHMDPSLTANEAAAKQIFLVALGQSAASGKLIRATPQDAGQPGRNANGTFKAKEDIPAPIFRERAGGKDVQGESMALSDSERAFIKHQGITEAEYLKTAATMPGGRR